VARVLGIHGNFGRGAHDPAAALVEDGRVVGMVEEERLVRHRRAPGLMPLHAVRWLLERAGVAIRDVDRVAFPQAGLGKTFAGRFARWLDFSFGHAPPVVYLDHHLCHAASTYYPSGYDAAVTLTLDTAGDGTSTAVFAGCDGDLRASARYTHPNSLGLFYSTISQLLGFRANADESKVMALAAFGEPRFDLERFMESDGELRLHTAMLSETALRLYPESWTTQEPLFGDRLVRAVGPPRRAGAPIEQCHADLAASAQRHLVRIVERLVVSAARHTTHPGDVCLAGGVALNCAMNGAVERLPCVRRVYVPPAPQDAGTALGAALIAARELGDAIVRGDADPYLGPAPEDGTVREQLERLGLSFEDCGDAVVEHAVERIAAGEIVGWFQGAMEVGPRALGNRSILADPRTPGIRRRINATIKSRESFLPVAPAVLFDHQAGSFASAEPSPYMSRAVPAREELAAALPEVVHRDGTARLQSVRASDNPRFHALLQAWRKASGVPVLINTSLNLRGQPIAYSLADAVGTLYGSALDRLYVGRFCVGK
jgi:carbamoyltransferase